MRKKVKKVRYLSAKKQPCPAYQCPFSRGLDWVKCPSWGRYVWDNMRECCLFRLNWYLRGMRTASVDLDEIDLLVRKYSKFVKDGNCIAVSYKGFYHVEDPSSELIKFDNNIRGMFISDKLDLLEKIAWSAVFRSDGYVRTIKGYTAEEIITQQMDSSSIGDTDKYEVIFINLTTLRIPLSERGMIRQTKDGDTVELDGIGITLQNFINSMRNKHLILVYDKNRSGLK